MWFDRNMLSLDLHKIPFWCLEPAIKKKKREDQVKDTWFDPRRRHKSLFGLFQDRN